MKSVYCLRAAVLSLLFGGGVSARAGLVITPTFDSSITGDPNAATIENTIDTAISNLEGDIANNVTVNITFSESSSGLGSSSTFIGEIPYSAYLNDIKNDQVLSADDVTAIASLPNTTANPANGSDYIFTSTPLLRALGYNAPEATDGTIQFNSSLVDDALGTPTGGRYSLESVITHEMDEVLGIGGVGSSLGSSLTNNPAGTLDLFRYSASGVRSYTTSSSATSYFSINSGVTNLVGFNQAGGGSDYSDWATGASPQVQDAFGTPGSNPQLGANEMTALDVIGWNLTPAGLALEQGVPVPEPSTYALLLGGFAALGFLRRFRKSA